MAEPPHRWIMPDLASALAWVRQRKEQRIRCSLAITREYARTRDEAEGAVSENIGCLREIASGKLDAALSIKPGALGSLFDTAACRENGLRIAREAAAHHIPLEVDMEGKGSVAFTIDLAIACATIHRPVTVALQAYLNRTQADIEIVVSHGIGVRLVKGAYLGDIQNFREIQDRMRAVAEDLLSREKPFSFATHDPDLIAWLLERLGGKRDPVEFGFIMGLSDQTKVRLSSDGWKVSEYVPFGPGGSAYILRRERYLRDLQQLGRTPAP